MIRRYYATKDNSITNALDATLVASGSDSNLGLSDILEVFTIYGQTSGSEGYSLEESKVLVEFDIEQIKEDLNNGVFPPEAKFFLRLFNAKHGQTLPRNYTLEVSNVSGSWQEGLGLDMENYSDLTLGYGSSWNTRSGSTEWVAPGGDEWPGLIETGNFEIGDEDLSLDVTALVGSWLNDTVPNDGFMIKLPASLSSLERSFYTKKFFARSSSNFFKRPLLEVRWNSSLMDDRANFYSYSVMASDDDNKNTIYLYNVQRGALSDIPSVGTGEIYVDLYDSLGGNKLTQVFENPATGGWVSTGIYSASVSVETSLDNIYDVWFDNNSQFISGTIEIVDPNLKTEPKINNLVCTVFNKKAKYYRNQTNRFYFYIRDRDWSPNIYVVANSTPQTLVFKDLHYKITKVVTDETIINYDQVDMSTLTSYDAKGNYFDLDLSILEANYEYEIKLSLKNPMSGFYEEIPFSYKFRVVDNEY